MTGRRRCYRWPMIVVVFRAHLDRVDAEYGATASRMRELAFAEHGCLDFTAVTEGDLEVAISYWPDEASIVAWKRHVEHQAAQARGRGGWYRDYKVEVARVERAYAWPPETRRGDAG